MASGLVEVEVNGLPAAFEPGTTLAQVVAAVTPEPHGVAVAVDREVVPRSRWSLVTVLPGQRIEVVTAAAGG